MILLVLDVQNLHTENVGKMENIDANQLPEVDSLPDGFVDSSVEPVALATPILEQEKALIVHEEDNISEHDHSNETPSELAKNASQTSQNVTEKSEKPRTFPVLLSRTDGCDASVNLIEVSDKGCEEQAEDALAKPDSVHLVSEASVRASGRSEVIEQVQGNCQSSGRCNYLLFQSKFLVSLSPIGLEFLMLAC